MLNGQRESGGEKNNGKQVPKRKKMRTAQASSG